MYLSLGRQATPLFRGYCDYIRKDRFNIIESSSSEIEQRPLMKDCFVCMQSEWVEL